MRHWSAVLLVAGLSLATLPAYGGWNRLAPGFTRVYEGEIDAKHPVRLTLTKRGQQFRGTYLYARVGKPLQLQGTIDGGRRVHVGRVRPLR